VHQANVSLLDDSSGRREADLRGRLENDQAAAADNLSPTETLDAKDYQLARAIDLLRGIALYEGRATAER
jgi:carboxyl-terminal processing protease